MQGVICNNFNMAQGRREESYPTVTVARERIFQFVASSSNLAVLFFTWLDQEQILVRENCAFAPLANNS